MKELKIQAEFDGNYCGNNCPLLIAGEKNYCRMEYLTRKGHKYE